MRTTAIALFMCILSSSIIASAADSESALSKPEYPGDVALSQQQPSGQWIYKSFPGLARLYIFDGDRPGKSNCKSGCASAWPPLLASRDAVGARLGEWTVIAREDGRKQWTYKGQPVYMRYHDTVEDMTSAGIDGFHPLEP